MRAKRFDAPESCRTMVGTTRRDLLAATATGATVGSLGGCAALLGACSEAGDAPRVPDAPDRRLGSLPDGRPWPGYGRDASRAASTDATGPAADPAHVWTFENDGNGVLGTAVAHGRVYASGSGGAALYALDPVSETLDWQYGAFDSASAPAAGPESVVVGAESGLHCVDAATGERRWRVDGLSFDTRPPAVAGDAVYASGYHYEDDPSDDRVAVVAVDLSTGERRWRVEVVPSSFCVADGQVLLGEPVRALDAASGAELWRPGDHEALGQGVAVRDGRLYAPSGRTVAAFDAADGTVLWTFAGEREAFRAPAVADGTVYLTSIPTEHGRSSVVALDAATGDRRWRADLGACQGAAPAVGSDLVYVPTGHGTVEAFRRDDGAVAWVYRGTRDATSYERAAVVDGAVFAGGRGRVDVLAEQSG